MEYDLHRVPEKGSLYLVGDIVSLNRKGRKLVVSIRKSRITGDAVARKVSEYLIQHGKAVGSYDISTARLALFEQLRTLAPGDIADRLEQVLTATDTQHQAMCGVIADIRTDLRSLLDHLFS